MGKLLIIACACLCAGTAWGASPEITAAGLRGDLSFLASDALEGRGTPSKGLDIAAEFIASRFRAAGLEPIGPDASYFQTAKFAQVTPKLRDFALTITTPAGQLNLTEADARVRSLNAVDMKDQPALLLPPNGVIPAVEGKVVVGQARRYGTEMFLNMLQARHPALIVLISRRRDNNAPPAEYLHDVEANLAPVVRIANADASSALTAKQPMTISVHIAAPDRKDVQLRNVGGILRGSDPALRDQFVIVSAHYDHLGLKESGPGDRIYNGANDDGSGTVSVIAIAQALAAAPERPKRSILFMTWFGEEEGLLGSYYYAQHPLAPLKNTIADLNLEQMGRPGDKPGVAFTGESFSDVVPLMRPALSAEGLSVYEEKSADDYFARSDNYALALNGVVAHTVVVAFDYPEYHALNDDWQKIDYDNMARVDRGLAAGVAALASGPAPKWTAVPGAGPYREAGK